MPDAIERAREIYTAHSAVTILGDDIEIDDNPATSEAADGTWVAAWVWVPHEDNEED